MLPIEIETLGLVEENMGIRIDVSNVFGFPPNEDNEDDDIEEEDE